MYPQNTINKVIYYGDTILDLTADTVTPDKLFKGVTAHSASGSAVTGEAEVVVMTNIYGTETGFIMPPGLMTFGPDSISA